MEMDMKKTIIKEYKNEEDEVSYNNFNFEKQLSPYETCNYTGI